MSATTADVVVFDVGGTFIKYGVVGSGRLRPLGKVPTPQDSRERFLAALRGVIDEACGGAAPSGIALSVPGTVDAERRMLVGGGALGYNHGASLDEWAEILGAPVEAQNDARSAALAELELGSLRGVDTGLALTFGTGVGCGVIVGGRLHEGAHGVAGEVGISYAGDARLGFGEFLGNAGGVGHIARAIGDACGRDVAGGEDAMELVQSGDERAVAVFEEHLSKVAQALYGFQMLLDPERISIGGGISANPLFVEGIVRANNRLYEALPFPFEHAEIVPCRFRNASNLIGAYLTFAHARGISSDIEIEGAA